MAKPVKLPEWDSTLQNIQETSGDQKSTGVQLTGGIPDKPNYKNWNYWMNLVYQWIEEVNGVGILDWDSTTVYAQYAWVTGSDGHLYQALGATTGDDPVSSPAEWEDKSDTFITVIDDLLSSSGTDALSANMGRVLYGITKSIPLVWDNAFDYQLDALIVSSNIFYRSIQTPNLNKTPASESDYWRPLIIDDLTSTFTDVMLSANQGKVLKDEIDAVADLIEPASETSRGVKFTFKRIITSDSADTKDLDFSGGNFSFDDGFNQADVIAMTKEFDKVWEAGTNNGGADRDPIAAITWWHLFAIYNPTTEATDYLGSPSIDFPNMPPGWTKKRYIGSRLRDGGRNLIPLIQIGKRFYWEEPFLEYTGAFSAIVTPFELEGAPPNIVTGSLISARASANPVVASFKPLFVTSDPANFMVTFSGGNWDGSDSNNYEIPTDLLARIGIVQISGAAAGTEIYCWGWNDYQLEN